MRTNSEIWLICGSRKKEPYRDLVKKEMDKVLYNFQHFIGINWKPKLVIHGACKDSADIWGRNWAIENKIKTKPFPSEKGKYLKRNIEMVDFTHEVFAFWDGFSYGTAQTVAQAIMKGKEVTVIKI